MMSVQQMIEAIERRQEKFWSAQTAGTPADPFVETAAGVVRAIADEYDSLLGKINRAPAQSEQRPNRLGRQIDLERE